MLVSIEWLRDWVSFDLATEELAQRLTMVGLEVESVSKVTPFDDRIVVGQIESVAWQDKTKRNSICQVNVGQDEQLVVVCGAPNILEGGKYPVALPGATIDGTTIDIAEIDSTRSEGMLCSAEELGLIGSGSGLLELDADAPVGRSLNRHYRTDDSVMNIELTPNRADCLSIRGVAREVGIIAQKGLKTRSEASVAAQSERGIPVEIENPEDCPAFCRRVIENIRTDGKTPDWMIQRLQRLGLRSIHPIVDITNYVMLDLGQPMHAFDIDVIDAAEITVRHSRPGEKLLLLDGETLDLGQGELLITDRRGPIALAGVMGGESSGISEQTTNIMLEAAFFSPQSIRRSVSTFSLHSDASHRFERGVDPTGQSAAIERATELILEIVGGTPGPTQEIRFDSFNERKRQCHVRYSRVNRILGLDIDHNAVESILSAVNETVTANHDGWHVVAPVYRFDLAEEHDQIEEVARIYGYDRVPSRMSFKPGVHRNLSETAVSDSSIRGSLHSLGYHEAITYSFVDPGLQNKVRPNANEFQLMNPIADNLSVMRSSLWPGLIDAFLENYRRKKENVRLYEIGRVFQSGGEIDVLGALIFGSVAPSQWGIEPRTVDYFDIKGDLEKLLELSGQGDCLEFRPETVRGLHPGRSAKIYLQDRNIGSIGQLHPDILDEVDSDRGVYVFEIEFDIISTRNITKYVAISRYPSVSRDLSLVVSANQAVSEITGSIWQSAGNSLESLTLFDIYSKLDEENALKSVTYRLIFRSDTRTLTDVEVDSSISNVLHELKRRHNVELRT